MNEKIAIALGSVLLGWILAQFAALAKDWLYRKWIKRALMDELLEIRDGLDEHWLNFSHMLQMHALGGIGNDAVLPIGNHIFTNHYKDAALALNRFQRRALQMTHAHITAINEAAASLKEFIAEIQDRNTREKALDVADLELVGLRLRALLSNVALAKWHVRHYLAHPTFPNLEIDTEVHREFERYVAQIEPEIDSIVEGARKSLRREDFDPRLAREAEA
jgi:hypothetical protein